MLFVVITLPPIALNISLAFDMSLSCSRSLFIILLFEASIFIIILAISYFDILLTDSSINPFSVSLYVFVISIFNASFKFILSPYRLFGILLSIFILKFIFLSCNFFL